MNSKSRPPLDENALIALWAICNGQGGNVVDGLLKGKIAFAGVNAPWLVAPKELISEVEAQSEVDIANARAREGVERKKLRYFLQDYLIDFREGNIDWSHCGLNILPWSRQEQGLSIVLHHMKNRFGAKFVLSHRDLHLEVGSRPVETLIALDEEGRVSIKKLIHKDVDIGDRVELVVEIINLPAVSTATETNDPVPTSRKKGGRPYGLKYSNGIFEYKRKEHIVRKSASYALLCDIFYPLCPTLDKSVHWEQVSKAMHSRSSESYDRERIRGLIRTLNNWATSDSVNIGRLLRLHEDHIERLK